MRWVLVALGLLALWGAKLAFDDRRARTPEERAHRSALRPARGLLFGLALGACLWTLAVIALLRLLG